MGDPTHNPTIIKSHPRFIHFGVALEGKDSWLLSIVYGSPTPSIRKFLWQDLNQTSQSLTDPWMVVGISMPFFVMRKSLTQVFFFLPTKKCIIF